jgi:apolipoprotein D and lipocalin family protein
MGVTPWASLVLIGCAAAASGANRTHTVSSVDLKRYMGRWYVIANTPKLLGTIKVASFDTYTLLSDGRIENDFTFRKGSFSAPEKIRHRKAIVVDTQTNAEWMIRFIWPFSSTYLVLDLDSDYQWAVVGTPDRKFLQVLARAPQIPDDLYARILGRLAYKDFDVAKLKKIPQPIS